MSAIKSYLVHGVTNTQLHGLLINRFYFPSEYRDCLASYYLKQTSGKCFSDRMKRGTLIDDDTEYLVVYHQGVLPAAACRAHRLNLSFRKPAAEYNLPAFVLVKIIAEIQHDLASSLPELTTSDTNTN